ncbi:MAG: hypothetical protein PHP08_00605 [Candidatus Dojkabacteria bacterium]|nr:hypothetical protein [Candidatus Dojkabacteria bacterium]
MNHPKYPPLISIDGTGLPHCWQQLVKKCMNEGMEKKRFYGKPVNTYDIVSMTEIRQPLLEPMLHPSFPTKELHCIEYEKQWEREYDWRKQGFEYNYTDRLTNYPSHAIGDSKFKDYYHKSGEEYFIDQLSSIADKITDRIEKGGECLVSNRDEAITWIPDRDLFVSEDQPCLQRLQVFVYEYPRAIYHGRDSDGDIIEERIGKAEFHCMWRSRDLFAAWNSNMIGLIKMMNREIFAPNNLELVRVVDFCNSLHIYESDWEQAGKIKMLPTNPQYMR